MQHRVRRASHALPDFLDSAARSLARSIKEDATILLRNLRIFLREQDPIHREGTLAIDNMIETASNWSHAWSLTKNQWLTKLLVESQTLDTAPRSLRLRGTSTQTFCMGISHHDTEVEIAQIISFVAPQTACEPCSN